ncbi:MAG: hypothetical protein A2174_00600 [Candidatus Portnoybacteria bacterium RBG_13_41_18]|uniref:GerMN domain-containing protein n=1 Tax=Candidatus Portnoybacteria bacterium RBG_13_41_18 TaxID=1801991 RepID=A0A1G2F5M1_9BACT|nr:MAG: hypothetical protein A2174_00600 [Candidatus Portnoybacteria bacterium RBG_13_41_18]
MKKALIIIAIIVIAAAVVIGLRLFSGDEDTWLCQNGQWVKHGNPNAPMPTTGCGTPSPEPEVVITFPQPNQIVTSPLTVEGKARGGNWFFEASAALRLLDANGNEIAISNIMATTDWMTTDYIEFKGQIRFISPANESGTLVFKNDNPSGLPQNDKEFRVPIRFNASQTMRVKVFFNNNNLDPQISCNLVFPVDREVPKTQAVARAALEELLIGPTFKEQNSGYITSINSGVKIQSLTIENGVARVDFDEQIEFQVGGSCRVTAIRAQITQTLKQFPTVTSVVISINGRTEDILQP